MRQSSGKQFRETQRRISRSQKRRHAMRRLLAGIYNMESSAREAAS